MPRKLSFFHSIQTQIFSLAIGCVAIAAFSIIALDYQQEKSYQQQNAADLLRTNDLLTSLRIKNEVNIAENDINTIALTPPIQGIIRSMTHQGIDPLDGSTLELWKKRLADIFTAVLKHKGTYEQIRYIGFGDDGKELVRVDRKAGHITVISEDALQVKKQESYFRQALGLNPNEVELSQITLNREHGEVTPERTLMIRILKPVYTHEDRAFGFLVINVNFKKMLLAAIQAMPYRFDTFVVEPNGGILKYTNKGKSLTFEQAHSNLHNSDLGKFILSNQQRLESLDQHADYYLYTTLLKLGGNQYGTTLKISTALTQADLLARAQETRSFNFEIAILFVLLAIIAAGLLSRRILKPLNIMHSQFTNTRQFGEHLNSILTLKNEFGVLAREFKTLLDIVIETEAQSKAILENAVDSIITIDSTGRVLKYNHASEIIFGYQASEVVGNNISMLIPEPRKSEHDRYIKNYLETRASNVIGKKRELIAQRKGGEIFPIELSVSEIAHGAETLFTGFVRDLSEKAASERYKTLIQNIAIDTNADVSLTAALTSILKNICQTLDWQVGHAFVYNEKNQIYSSPGAWYLAPEIKDRLTSFVEQSKTIHLSYNMGIIQALEHERVPLWITRDDFSQRPYRERQLDQKILSTGVLIPIFVNNKLEGILEIFHTKTIMINYDTISLLNDVIVKLVNRVFERVRAGDELQRYIKALEVSNQDLDSFAYAASHDLKAPLRAIDNVSQWLLEDLETVLEGENLENMHILRRRVKRMENLLEALLEYSRIGKKKEKSFSETVTFQGLLEDIKLLLDQPRHFIIEYPDSYNQHLFYRMPLQAILLNLFSNSIKHHDKEQGCISIRVEETPTHYHFYVEDDGPGIPTEYHERVFKMFQTLQSRDDVEGSGMGLAMVKKHVEESKGQIRILDRQDERGTVFYIVWPKANCPSTLFETGVDH